MLHSGRFKAVLDACVLYPAPLRDLLLCLAEAGLYKPRWSDIIQSEWIGNLLLKRVDLSRERLKRTAGLMNRAFPDAEVGGFHELIGSLSLPDENDNHVLAAAIRCNADVIVTMNLSDFPDAYLEKYDIEAQHPDIFITHLIELDPEKSREAFLNQVKRLSNPRKTSKEVLTALEKCGLEQSVKKLEEAS